MARFVDLEVEDEPPQDGILHHSVPVHDASLPGTGGSQSHDAPKPKRAAPSTAMSRAFNCYPIVIGIVSAIDLTTLDSLARTSRAVHDGLIQYRSILVASTLRCINEDVPIDRDETLRYRAAQTSSSNWVYMDGGRTSSTPAKAGNCARDMVGECRRCAEVICRNCAIKPPAPVALRERHRRLCKTCVRAPLTSLSTPKLDPGLSLVSDSVQDAICQCEAGGVWLCQPCGRTIRNADHDYQCVWRWRNHYGESLGCLGTGIGDGDRGVICGRDSNCLAAREREQETDCDAEDARGSPGSSSSDRHSPPTPQNHHATSYFPIMTASNQSIESLVEEYRHERTPSPLLGPGYERHEIEGIGGIVKRKLVRMVRVGACVPEWEDEKSHSHGAGPSRVLGHEVRGDVRSWCGWCNRVVPGKKDRADMARDQMLADQKVKTMEVQMPMHIAASQQRPIMCAPVSS